MNEKTKAYANLLKAVVTSKPNDDITQDIPMDYNYYIDRWVECDNKSGYGNI